MRICVLFTLGAFAISVFCGTAALAQDAGTGVTNLMSVSVQQNGGSAFDGSVPTATTTTRANDSSPMTTAMTSQADVGVTMSVSSMIAGQTATYTIGVTNSGPSDAQTVALTDVLPLFMTFVSMMQTAGPTFSCTTPNAGAGGTVTCNIATLASGESVTFSLIVNVPAAFIDGSTFSNTATVTTATTDPNAANNAVMTTSRVGNSADLEVTNVGPASARPGQNVTYTVAVANHGPSQAEVDFFTDNLPASTTFVSLGNATGMSCFPYPQLSPTSVDCEALTELIGRGLTLLPGESAVLYVVVNVDATATGLISNTAGVSARTNDPNLANNSATTTLTVVSADLAVANTAPTSVVAGQNITYTIGVVNNGAATAQTVSLADAIPTGTTFVSEAQTAGPPFNCATPSPGGTGTVTCTIAALNSGTSANFTLVVGTSAGTAVSVNNTATVSSATADPSPANNSSTTNVGIVPATPALSPSGLLLLAMALASAGVFLMRNR